MSKSMVEQEILTSSDLLRPYILKSLKPVFIHPLLVCFKMTFRVSFTES